jgi:hypothetical protein
MTLPAGRQALTLDFKILKLVLGFQLLAFGFKH